MILGGERGSVHIVHGVTYQLCRVLVYTDVAFL